MTRVPSSLLREQGELELPRRGFRHTRVEGSDRLRLHRNFCFMRWTETSEVSLTQCKRILENHTRGTRLCRYVYDAFSPLCALAEVADII